MLQKFTRSLSQMFDLNLMQNRNYRFYWLGQAVSMLGNHFTMLAIPLLIVHLGGSSDDVAYAISIVTLPPLLFSLVAGVIADSIPTKKMLLLLHVTVIVTLGTMYVGYNLNFLTIGLIYTLVFITGTCGTFASIVQSTLIKSIVPADSLVDAGAKIQQVNVLWTFMGPAIAGFVIEYFNLSIAILVDTLTFTAALYFFHRIFFKETVKTANLKSMTEFKAALMEGLKWPLQPTESSRNFLFASLLSFIITIGMAAPTGLLVYHLKVNLGLSAEKIGSFMAISSGIGFFFGSFLVKRLSAKLGVFKVMGGASALTVLSIGGLGLTTQLTLMGLAFVFYNFAVVIFRVSMSSYIIKIIPKEVLGRVMSISQLFSRGAFPFGALFYGWLSSQIGVAESFLVAAGLGGAALTLLVFLPGKMRVAQPTFKKEAVTS